MSSKTGTFNCSVVSLVVGLAAGLLFAALLRGAYGWGFVPTFLAGLVMFLGVALLLRWALCTDPAEENGAGILDGHEAVGAPAAMPKPAPAPQPAPAAPLTGPETVAKAAPAKAAAPVEKPAGRPAAKPAAKAKPAPKAAPKAAEAATGEGTRPEALAAARGGQADDLKKIKGVGPKLEELLHSMGFYHFDQIAAWSGDEVAWVDQNLKGFKGRVSRDGWVAQARTLAEGGETEFSKRVDKGQVY